MLLFQKLQTNNSSVLSNNCKKFKKLLETKNHENILKSSKELKNKQEKNR